MAAKAQVQVLRDVAAEQRRSDDVMQRGLAVLARFSSWTLGDDAWTVREQVFIACLDDLPALLPKAKELLQSLQAKFGKSSLRVQRLEGMLHEAQGDYTKADEVYTAMLTKDATYTPALKRKVAVLKAQGQLEEATRLLVNYVDTFMADADAWQELCELYLAQFMYPQAQFCMEELVLMDPNNAARFLKLALILHTRGGQENLLLAKKYYCKVLDLNQSNIRALWGLKLCCKALAGLKNVDGDARVNELGEFATERLGALYAPSPTKHITKSTLSSI